MTRRPSRPLRWLVTTAGLLATPVHAQDALPLLHRPIPGDLPLDDTAHADSLTAPLSTSDVLASAGQSIDPNEPRAPAVGGDVTHPRTSWEPPARELDRDTRSPDGLHLGYGEVFTPAIAPFKRLQAYDGVDTAGRLVVRDPSLHDVVPGEAAPERWGDGARARFVGDLLVEVTPGSPTPLPGVAGDERIVSYATSTGASLAFAVDGAGNLFVRGVRAETLRITYTVEVPERAFVPSYLPSTPVSRLAQHIDPDLRPTVPAWLPSRASVVLEHIGVSRAAPFDRALNALVGYFRAFHDGDLASTSGDLYTDLAMGGVGACRHRAYAFVLTLHALGIPARYVGNEAHAWAEVYVNGVWSRVDLGGWDVPLDATAPGERSVFRPSTADPFPRPAEYTSQYSAGTATTMSSGASGNGGGHANGSGAGNASMANGGATPDDQPASTGGTDDGDTSAGTSARASTANTTGANTGSDAREARIAVRLAVDDVRADAQAGVSSPRGFVRGSVVRVQGTAADEQGAAIASLPVDVVLVRDGREVSRLGSTVTDAGGHWSAGVLLPVALDAGAYELRVVSDGSARYAAGSGG